MTQFSISYCKGKTKFITVFVSFPFFFRLQFGKLVNPFSLFHSFFDFLTFHIIFLKKWSFTYAHWTFFGMKNKFCACALDIESNHIHLIEKSVILVLVRFSSLWVGDGGSSLWFSSYCFMYHLESEGGSMKKIYFAILEAHQYYFWECHIFIIFIFVPLPQY